MRYVGSGGGDTFTVTAAAAGTEHVLDDFRSGTDTIDLRLLGVHYFGPDVRDGRGRPAGPHPGGGRRLITLRLKNVSGNPPASDFLFA